MAYVLRDYEYLTHVRRKIEAEVWGGGVGGGGGSCGWVRPGGVGCDWWGRGRGEWVGRWVGGCGGRGGGGFFNLCAPRSLILKPLFAGSNLTF